MKNLIVVAVLFHMLMLGAWGVALYASNENPDFTKTYPTSKGTVTFNHQGHSVQGDCQTCHSAVEMLGGTMNKKIGHNLCRACHKQMDDGLAPTVCTGCHRR